MRNTRLVVFSIVISIIALLVVILFAFMSGDVHQTHLRCMDGDKIVFDGQTDDGLHYKGPSGQAVLYYWYVEGVKHQVTGNIHCSEVEIEK